MTKEDHGEYIRYKRDIMMMDEQSAAKIEESVLCLFNAGETKTQVAEDLGISLSEVRAIIDGLR